jgi:predicted RNA methylase
LPGIRACLAKALRILDVIKRRHKAKYHPSRFAI